MNATVASTATTDWDVVVTGAGLVSAAGSSMAALTKSLDRREHCLSLITSFDSTGMVATHAGQVGDFAPLAALPPSRVRNVDRGTQMAVVAARQALDQAGLDASTIAGAGVAVGTSGSPQYQNLRATPDHRPPTTRQAALYAARSTSNFQADVLARAFGLGGPRFAFGSASLGGLLALGHAMDMLRMNHAPAFLMGGGEILTLVNALGMDALGVNAAGPCTPFAGDGGICFGEGAAFFVLERRVDAERRGATVLAELVGTGFSADAYSDVAQDPTGQGLARAMRKSLCNSGVDAAAIGWIRGCGTGQRDLDAAEGLALQAVFAAAPPPITSTEPYFSHVNGVSPLLGLTAVLAALASGRAPGQPEPTAVRPNLSVTLLPPGKLPDGDCLLTATAFGGTNGAVVVRAANRGASAGRRRDNTLQDCIVIAGMGAVSALGGTVDALLAGVAVPPVAVPAIDTLADPTLANPTLANPTLADARGGHAARLVNDAWLNPKLPGITLQRRERLGRMALLAVHQALTNAQVASRGSARFGLLVGLTRGPLAAYKRFLDQTMQGRFDISTGRALLRIGRFSVASEIANAFKLFGYSGAMASGVHGGVQLLAHGSELLRANPDLDGLVVVAADEWTPLQEALYRKLGLLGDGAAHDDAASGCIGGEGAAALLLCRRPRGLRVASDWAVIDGAGFGGDTSIIPDATGIAYRRTITTAIARAGLGPDQIEFAIGQGCGWPAHDQREWAAFRPVCGDTPLTSVLPHTGLAESAGGLFAAMVAAGALRGGDLPALPFRRTSAAPGCRSGAAGKPAGYRHGILLGSTERGAHAAVVVSRIAA